MAWCQTGDKLLSEPMMAQFTDEYICHSVLLIYSVPFSVPFGQYFFNPHRHITEHILKLFWTLLMIPQGFRTTPIKDTDMLQLCTLVLKCCSKCVMRTSIWGYMQRPLVTQGFHKVCPCHDVIGFLQTIVMTSSCSCRRSWRRTTRIMTISYLLRSSKRVILKNAVNR